MTHLVPGTQVITRVYAPFSFPESGRTHKVVWAKAQVPHHIKTDPYGEQERALDSRVHAAPLPNDSVKISPARGDIAVSAVVVETYGFGNTLGTVECEVTWTVGESGAELTPALLADHWLAFTFGPIKAAFRDALGNIDTRLTDTQWMAPLTLLLPGRPMRHISDEQFEDLRQAVGAGAGRVSSLRCGDMAGVANWNGAAFYVLWDYPGPAAREGLAGRLREGAASGQKGSIATQVTQSDHEILTLMLEDRRNVAFFIMRCLCWDWHHQDHVTRNALAALVRVSSGQTADPDLQESFRQQLHDLHRMFLILEPTRLAMEEVHYGLLETLRRGWRVEGQHRRTRESLEELERLRRLAMDEREARREQQLNRLLVLLTVVGFAGTIAGVLAALKLETTHWSFSNAGRLACILLAIPAIGIAIRFGASAMKWWEARVAADSKSRVTIFGKWQ